MMHNPEIVDAIRAEPHLEYLHWRKDGRYREASIMSSAEQMVAEVLHRPNARVARKNALPQLHSPF